MNRQLSYGIYVGNIDPTMTLANLRTLFATAGQIVHVNLLGPEGGTHRYGFVEYDSDIGRGRAIEMFNNYRFGNKNLKVCETKTRTTRVTDTRSANVGTDSSGIDRGDSGATHGDGYLINRTSLQKQLLQEFTLQQYAAALQLEHAKLILRAKEFDGKESKKAKHRS